MRPSGGTAQGSAASTGKTGLLEEDDLHRELVRAGLDVRPIPRIQHASVQEARRSIAERRGPLLFPGLSDGWEARRTWNPPDLARDHGHKTVTALMGLPASGTTFPRSQPSYARTLSFADFLASMMTASAANPCYLAYVRPDELVPQRDYDFAPLVQDREHPTDTRLWIGSTGTRSMLHSDLKDNLFCQIWGQKHVVLLSWEHSRAAYPCVNNIVNSRVDLAEFDLKRFPRLKSAVLYSTTLVPGDVLLVPRGCWHDMRSRTPSISLNHWFGPPLALADYAALLLRLGPRFWAATLVDFVRYGVLNRPEPTRFFFSPPSTGRRVYDLIRWGDFSRANDPTKAEGPVDGTIRHT